MMARMEWYNSLAKPSWTPAPSTISLSSVADVAVVSLLAVFGILMTVVSPLFIVGLMALVVVYFVLLDCLKTQLFRHLDLP